MSEEKIVSVMHERELASEKRDVEKMLSFLAEDVVWTNNEGTFKGKEEVKRYWTWEAQRMSNAKVRAAGIGTMVKGNIAVQELVFEGSTSDGRRFGEIPVIIVEEFSGEKNPAAQRVFRQAISGETRGKGMVRKNDCRSNRESSRRRVALT